MFAYAFNNPVMYDDPTGNWPKLSTIFTVVAVAAVAVAAVAVVVATCGAAAPALALAGGGIVGGMSAGAIATATTVATIATVTAVAATTAAVVTSKAEKPNNSVYVLKDDKGTVQYVGRTTDVAKRTKAHEANPARAGLKLEVIQPNLNYVQARAVEQAAMAYHHTINTANKMNNQINGISPFNPKLGMYKEAAVGMLGYAWNQVSNEILYWTGN
jgi:predicted GIY-YIG superfamily endonuclease